MNCEKFELLIALQVENDLPPHELIKVETHLAACPACREFAAELRASQVAVHLLSEPEFSEAACADLRRSVMNKVAVSSAGPDFWRRLLRLPGWQYAAAGLFALLFLSVVFYLTRPDPPPVSASIQKPNEPLPEVKPITAQSATPQPARPDKPRHHRSTARTKFVKAPEVELHNDVAVVTKLPEAETIPESGSADSATDTEPAPASDDQKIRMEIQTRDPNIRIIWFLNKEPRRTASD